jgi:hypothetical protein
VALGERHDGVAAAGQRFEQEAGSALAGLVDVDMGVFLVADQEGAGLEHARGDVAVQVEADADPGFRREGLADFLDDLAFGVGLILDHHGAVQGEEDGVDGGGGLEAV